MLANIGSIYSSTLCSSMYLFNIIWYLILTFWLHINKQQNNKVEVYIYRYCRVFWHTIYVFFAKSASEKYIETPIILMQNKYNTIAVYISHSYIHNKYIMRIANVWLRFILWTNKDDVPRDERSFNFYRSRRFHYISIL